MITLDADTYYKIEVTCDTVSFNTWIGYTGELTGIGEFFGCPPIKFSSKEDAMTKIKSDAYFKDGHWRIVKVTTIEEIVGESHD